MGHQEQTDEVMDWIYDPTPPSGARTGGDVAVHAFKPDINTFIREVLQNCKDAAAPGSTEPVVVLFRLVRLRGSQAQSFIETMKWTSLQPHLAAAAEQPNGEAIRQALRRYAETGEVVLLLVEDRHTLGLRGPEDGDGNFAALCRDRLFSNKADPAAGGSYGLGKAVLWCFSGFASVLFNSNLHAPPGGMQSNPRFIGRVTLPWHRLPDGSTYAGDGWLGQVAGMGTGKRAESLWGPAAAGAGRKLLLPRNGDSGTSIVVVGFREPAYEDRPLEDLAQAMERAASIWFWPSLTPRSPTLEVQIEVVDGGTTISSRRVTTHTAVEAFVDALEKYRAGTTMRELKNPGDVAVVTIPVQLPARTDGATGRLDVEATLLVRLAEPDIPTDDPHRNCVAYFRHAGMVVKYRKLERLSLTARPFHAILVCGAAREPGNTPEDEALEAFLRASEPPEHNDWATTAKLKQTYRRGYGEAINQMNAVVQQKLRELVSESSAGGTTGPSLLMRKFPIGPRDGGGGGKQPYQFRGLKAELNSNGEWQFSGTVAARTSVERGWEVVVDVAFAEDGGRGEGGMIGTLSASSGTAVIRNGRGFILVAADTKEVTFKGLTDRRRHPIEASEGTVELAVNGRALTGSDNAI